MQDLRGRHRGRQLLAPGGDPRVPGEHRGWRPFAPRGDPRAPGDPEGVISNLQFYKYDYCIENAPISTAVPKATSFIVIIGCGFG